MKADVMTFNSMYKDGEIVGGYHEIHNIAFLSNTEHLIATVDSIIKNNLLYGCDDTVLERVYVGCDDLNAVEYIIKHCDDIFHYRDVGVDIGLGLLEE